MKTKGSAPYADTCNRNDRPAGLRRADGRRGGLSADKRQRLFPSGRDGADGKGAVLDINSLILFDDNSIKIKEEAKPALDKIAKLLSDNKYKRFQIVVEGHTDDAPFRSKEFPSNWELSSARAGAIVRYFILKELVPERFQAVGMAGVSPKYPNLNHFGEPIPENRIRNRRVVIHVEI